MASSYSVVVDPSNLGSVELELELRTRNIPLTNNKCISILAKLWKVKNIGKRLSIQMRWFQSIEEELTIYQSKLGAIKPPITVIITDF